MKCLMVFAIGTVLLGGCTEVDKFWEKEVVEVYAPSKVRERDRTRLGESLDYFLGKTKSERIRVIGAPDSCARLNTGEETCEWTPKAATFQQRVTYIYDRDGIARGWSYQGPLGEFTNANYLQAASKPTRSPQPFQQPN